MAAAALEIAIDDLSLRLATPRRGDLAGEARFELLCAACGYGVVVRIAPEACPMCRGSVWEHPRALASVPALGAL